MKTKQLVLEKSEYERSIKAAADILNNGGIVAIPTETVYGLAASAYDEKAIEKVFRAKGRPQDNPLIVHIADMSALYEIARDIPERALKCAEKFWPGPFTMVLKKSGKTAECVSAGLDTVAVRMPSDKVARDVILKSGLPLAAPSANLSGSPSTTTAQHVIDDLSGKIDAVIMAGECAVGLESTVVDFTSKKPRLLRPGGITLEQLKEQLPDIEVDKAVFCEPEKGAKVASPGMKYKHYAPKTESYLVESSSEKFTEFVNSKSSSAAICFGEDAEGIIIPKIVYGNSDDLSSLAHNIFEVLRKADEMGVEKIYIHAPEKTGVGLAVYNRLIRAAAFRVIKL